MCGEQHKKWKNSKGVFDNQARGPAHLPVCLMVNPALDEEPSPGHMRKNAYYSNLKWTFEDLLPCYCYVIKTNSRTNR